MKIITYNLNNGGESKWKAILEQDPSILLLQESQQPPEEFKQRAFWRPTKGIWGSAIYVKDGVISPVEIQHKYDWLDGWLVVIDLQLLVPPLGLPTKARIFSLHAPPREISGKSYPKTVDLLLDVIEANRGDRELVLGGDFNLLSLAQRHVDEKKESGEPWTVTKDEYGIQQRLIDLGLINCWQTANPGIPLPQTLRWRRNTYPAFHCDGIFIPAAWKGSLVSSHILDSAEWRLQSDHNPVVATLAISPS